MFSPSRLKKALMFKPVRLKDGLLRAGLIGLWLCFVHVWSWHEPSPAYLRMTFTLSACSLAGWAFVRRRDVGDCVIASPRASMWVCVVCLAVIISATGFWFHLERMRASSRHPWSDAPSDAHSRESDHNLPKPGQ